MRYGRGSKNRRFAAGIVSILMFVAVLFSAFYVTAQQDHDCPGHDCPVCACMQQCERTIRQIGSGVIAQIAVIVSLILLVLSAFFSADYLQQSTPVLDKVRMND